MDSAQDLPRELKDFTLLLGEVVEQAMFLGQIVSWSSRSASKMVVIGCLRSSFE